MSMMIGQLSGRKSLRDITDNLKAQHPKLYHLEIKKTSSAILRHPMDYRVGGCPTIRAEAKTQKFENRFWLV